MCCGRDKKENEVKNRPVEMKKRQVEKTNPSDLKKNGNNSLMEEDNQYVNRFGKGDL
jgi:hypothetical protein